MSEDHRHALTPGQADHEHPPAGDDGEQMSVCSHCTVDTMLVCIRCKRSYCVDCLERRDAGNICFECLGLPPPEIQRRARAAGQVLKVTGIATALSLVQVYVSLDRPFSTWGMILGVAVGFLVATRLGGIERERGMSGAITFGAMSILQGLLIATVLITVLRFGGVIEPLTGRAPAGTLPVQIIDLLIRSLFYYMVSVATVGAVLWQKSRF